MSHCYPAPGTNTTELDTLGLDQLEYHLGYLPVHLTNNSNTTFGLEPVQVVLQYDIQASQIAQYRAPMLSDYDNLYGLIAQAIATVTTSGYYGVAEVPTEGSTPRSAYIVRNYIIGIVWVILAFTPFLSMLVLALSLRQEVPLRKATFFTIANAVRGLKWDEHLHGGCVMPAESLRRRYRGTRVMYGVVDDDMPNHVGFASEVLPIQRNVLYTGVRQKKKKKKKKTE
jgi:hypothetical protein